MFVYKKNLLLIKLGELIGQKSIKYDVATMYNYTVMALLMWNVINLKPPKNVN